MVGAVVPITILFCVWKFKLSGLKLIVATSVASVLALVQVFMMRYNVVIGGQEISKTMRGYLEYQVPVFGIEGALAAIGAILFSLFLAYVFVKIFTIDFEDEEVIEDEAESLSKGEAITIEEVQT